MSTNKNIAFKAIDYAIIGSAIIILLVSWIYAGMEYIDLPDQIPSHFNHKGEADGYGGKSVLWYLMSTFTVMTGILFLIAKNTSMHNVQLKTTGANFRSVAIFMPFLALIQAIAVFTIIESAKGTFSYSTWILPSILLLTAVFITLMFIIIRKNKKS